MCDVLSAEEDVMSENRKSTCSNARNARTNSTKIMIVNQAWLRYDDIPEYLAKKKAERA